MALLTDKQIDKLKTYKHSSPKTSLELFYTNNVLYYVEKYLIPNYLSANSVTIMGQILPICVLALFLSTT